jgi:hypothetical protein
MTSSPGGSSKANPRRTTLGSKPRPNGCETSAPAPGANGSISENGHEPARACPHPAGRSASDSPRVYELKPGGYSERANSRNALEIDRDPDGNELSRERLLPSTRMVEFYVDQAFQVGRPLDGSFVEHRNT